MSSPGLAKRITLGAFGNYMKLGRRLVSHVVDVLADQHAVVEDG